MQQVMFTSRVLRDETTASWLDRFAGGGMEDVHAADALRDAGGARASSGAVLRALLTAPPETIAVRKPFAGRGGSTATNPYIKRKFLEYDVRLEPRTVGRRVLDARLALAAELARDLTQVGQEDARLWRCFRDAVDRGVGVDVADALHEPASTALVDKAAYPAVEAGGPHRCATYDLALNLTLHLAAGCVVRDLAGCGRAGAAAEAEWLRQFCGARARLLLAPPRGIRRAADAFAAALLAEPPVLRGASVLRDPMRLCERLLEARRAVARVWIEALGGAAGEHLALERELLEGGL
jgi:hypothetical protein